MQPLWPNGVPISLKSFVGEGLVHTNYYIEPIPHGNISKTKGWKVLWVLRWLDLGEPTHALGPCWRPITLPSRNQCTGWFALTRRLGRPIASISIRETNHKETIDVTKLQMLVVIQIVDHDCSRPIEQQNPPNLLQTKNGVSNQNQNMPTACQCQGGRKYAQASSPKHLRYNHLPLKYAPV